jgi:hypothetical protein
MFALPRNAIFTGSWLSGISEPVVNVTVAG